MYDSVRFLDKNTAATQLKDVDGEKSDFGLAVTCCAVNRCNIGAWALNLKFQMRKALRKNVGKKHVTQSRQICTWVKAAKAVKAASYTMTSK